MLRLHYSNRLENLIEPLAVAIRDRQAHEPITSIPIIVANRAVEQFVKYRLAERLGVAANLEFPFLRHHLAEIVKMADPQLQILEAEELRMVLFECIRDPARRSQAEMGAIRSYADLATVGTDRRAEARRELRLFQLAERIARLFREYSITRERMLREWRDRRHFTEGPFAETEKWQYALWRTAFDSKGALRSEFRAERGERWMLLPDAFAAIGPDRLLSVVAPAIHVFALPNAGPAYVRIFSALAQVTELHVYALNPCLEFWEDVRTIGHVAREGWVRRGARLKEEISDAKDQFHLLDGDTRALKIWGRPGREYVRLLNELAQCDFDARFERPAASGERSLLVTLQEEILMREPEAEEKREGDPAFASDRSIRILACPGVRREVEAVAGAIWSLVVKNSRKDPIRFHEIAVLIPEAACDTYLPHIETVFQEQHGLPVEIVTRRFVRQSRVAEAIDLMLKLPLGRFTRDEMVTLLTHPAVAGDDGDYDVERWSAWCREVGVVYGAEADELSNTYIGAGLFHWDQALTRLALGVFMTGERSGDTGCSPSAPPPPSGFLGKDYALLQAPAAGSEQKAELAYINPNGNFPSYNKIMIAPVTFWADDDSKVSAQDQQTLCNYFDNVLKETFGKNFTLVNEPGPGVAKLSAALIDASSATPVLRTVSVVIPQAHVLNIIKYGLTGTYAFVGSATGQAKLTDSVSGTLLAAWEDKQFGTAAIRNATVWDWGDADNAMNYWANGLDQKLTSLGVQHVTSTVAKQ